MKEISNVWEKMLSIFKTELNETSYKTWFLPLSQNKIDTDTKILYLECPDEFVRDVLNKRYMENLDQKAHTVLGEQYKVVIKLKSELEEEEEILKTEPVEIKKAENPKHTLKDEYFLNPRYNFDNFVEGNNNKHARAASLAVAKSPSLAFNPLFIYGGSGLGKTHLMHAIGHYILENYPEKNVLYVSSEMFTNELIKSLEDNKKSRMRAFKNKYRNLDVLLIDDIQFLENKEATQEEFFHTFNVLHSAGKQIILSSDKPPKEMETLEERFRSRFEWGLIADIQQPDYETRMAILKKNAESYGKEIDEEIFDYIASNIKSNIRELEGAFNKVIAFSRLNKVDITLNNVEEALKDIISPNVVKQVTPQLIINVVADHFSITSDDITSKRRNSEFVQPRQICMYLCRKLTAESLQSIGKALGKKDHTTVIHGIDKISEEIQTNEELKNRIDVIMKKINPS